MKKVISFFLILMCLTMSFCVFQSNTVQALATGTTTIGVSPNPANINSEITVTVTLTAPANLTITGGFQASLKYDTNYLKFISGSGVISSDNAGIVSFVAAVNGVETPKQVSATLKFKTLKAGKTELNVINCIFDETGCGFTMPTKDSTVSIVAPTKSSDNTLKSIKISAGTLSPAFSKNVTEYKVTVPYSVDYFDIQPTTNHKGASYKFSDGPGPNIKVGTTVRVVTVTAENGAVKKYNITVTRLPADTTSSSTSSNDTSSTTSTVEPEENKLETSVDGNKMTVAEIIPEDVTAAGFTKGEYTFNSVHVPAFLDKDSKIVLLYLLNEENEGALYLYDSATGLFKTPIILSGAKNYTIIPVNSITRDQILIDTENVFSLSTVTIGEQEVEAYVYKDEKLSDFAIVCAINDEGEKGFYRYDTKEGTLQRYVAEYRESEKTSANVNGLVLNDTIVVISCAAACIVAIIAIIIIWAVRRRRFLDDDFEDDFEDDFDDAEPLFIKETEFDENDEAENFAEDEETDENRQSDGENGSEEE